MTTLLLSHPACLNHLTPQGHPERPDRLRAVERALEHERFQTLARGQAPMATIEMIALAHPMDYVEQVREASPREGMVRLDADTTMSPGTFEAVMRAAGGAALAVDEVFAKKADNVFVATRPPGHHAETATPMGFCLFNNAAIAARYSQKQHGAERVAIVDFDVHHGNGSQDIFWNDDTVMYCSTHQMPLYPGTGAVSERGARNTVVNAPLRPGDGGDQFRDAMQSTILPRLESFAPDLIVISAGFDAHMRDPLANLNFVEADYTWVTQQLMGVADRHAEGRIVSLLEGGYDLEGLSKSVAAHVMALMRGDLEGRVDYQGAMAEPNSDVAKLSFEKSLAELEQIVQKLERGDVPLEESVAIYERGETLKRRCEELLRQAEARVEKITLDASGKPAGTEPLDVK